MSFFRRRARVSPVSARRARRGSAGRSEEHGSTTRRRDLVKVIRLYSHRTTVMARRSRRESGWARRDAAGRGHGYDMSWLSFVSTVPLGDFLPPLPRHARGGGSAHSSFPCLVLHTRLCLVLFVTAPPCCLPCLRHGCERDELGGVSEVLRSTASIESTVSSLVKWSPV